MKKILSILFSLLIAGSLWAQDAWSPRLGVIGAGGLTFLDDSQIRFGTGLDFVCEYDTAQTPDAMVCGVSADSRNWIITERADLNTDFGHALQANPTLWIQSADQTVPAQYVSIAHNQTNAVFSRGTGSFSFDALHQWSAGQAITASSYQIGRDFDATNQLHFNVPTGAGFEMSINDVPRLTLTNADLTANPTTGISWTTAQITSQANFIAYTMQNVSSGAATHWEYTGGTHTARTASTEVIDFYINGTNALQHLTGNYALQRMMVIAPRTYTFVAASTVDVASTVTIVSNVIAGANATISEARALAIGAAAGGAGTTTGTVGIAIANQSLAGSTTSYGLQIDSQTANATTTRAIEIAGTGVNNAVRLGSSPNIYSNAAENIRFMNSTNARGIDFNLGLGAQNIEAIIGALQISSQAEVVQILDSTLVNGIDFVLSTGATQSIRTLSATTGTIALQSQTFTPGVTHNAISIEPTWSAEGFTHRALNINATQDGSNAVSLVGLRLVNTKTALVTTLVNSQNLLIDAPSVLGTITNHYAIDIVDQAVAGITTPRVMRIQGTGASNAIILGNSALLYSNAIEQVTFADSTDVDGIRFVLATGNQSIRTVDTDTTQLRLQDQTFTPGAAHSAIWIGPGWTAENFNHTALEISPSQTGDNTGDLRGITFSMRKLTAATTLDEMAAIWILPPSITGTVSNNYGINIVDQTNANITLSRAIHIAGTGAANAIELGNSPLIYSSGAEVINFMDSTAARGIRMTLTAGGSQTIGTTAGSLILIGAGTNVITMSANDVRMTPASGVAQTTLDGAFGGCLMLRDTDDLGWTECDALDGVLTCSIDADGVCD